MMKQIMSLFVLLILAGCTLEESIDDVGRVPITLTATIGDAAQSRAGTAVNNSFSVGDAFYAYFPTGVTIGETSSASSIVYAYDGSQWRSGVPASFNSDASSCTVYAYYPSAVTNSTTSFSVQQNQSTDAAYKNSDLMYATSSIPKSDPVGNLAFAHKMAKILVYVTAGSGVNTIQEIRLIGGYRTIDVTTPLTCTLGTTLSDENSVDSYITMYSSGAYGSASCACLIPPQTISGNLLQIVTNAGTTVCSIDSKTFASGQSYSLAVTVSQAAIGSTIAISGWAESGNVNITPVLTTAPPNAVAVDLGLPSGTLWANMNIGATSETDFGTYFAWGETYGGEADGNKRKLERGLKTVFNGDTYSFIYYYTSNNTTYYKETRYCQLDKAANYWWTAVANELPDNETQLAWYDDAAYMNWGGAWSMPTLRQAEELLAETDREKITDYNGTGVTVWKLSSKSDPTKFIVLPAAGGLGGTVDETQNRYNLNKACYWTSTLYYNTPSRGYLLTDYNSEMLTVYNHYRYIGYSIRAVITPEVQTVKSISEAMPSDVGKLICSAGHIHEDKYEARRCGCSPSGIIAYVNEDGETRTDCPDTSGSYRGLALALTDISYTATQKWYTANSGTCTQQSTALTVLTWYDGFLKTDTLTNGHDSHVHEAATACKNFGDPRPAGASGWFLPSIGQWNLMAKALSTKGGQTAVPDFTSSSNTKLNYTNVSVYLNRAGGAGIRNGSYNSSSEYSASNRWYMNTGGSVSNTGKSTAQFTRACFAF